MKKKTREEQREVLEQMGFSPGVLNMVDDLDTDNSDLWYETLSHMHPHTVRSMNRNCAQMERERNASSGNQANQRSR